MGEICIFVFQAGEIAVVHGFLLVFLGNGVDVEQAGLSEEDGLHLEDVVAMMSHLVKRHVESPLFEGIPIDAETVVAGEGDEVSVLPRAVGPLGTPCYVLRLALKPFGLKSRHP